MIEFSDVLQLAVFVHSYRIKKRLHIIMQRCVNGIDHLELNCSTLPLKMDFPINSDSCCKQSVEVTCSWGLSLVYTQKNMRQCFNRAIITQVETGLIVDMTDQPIKYGIQESFQMLLERSFTNRLSNHR